MPNLGLGPAIAVSAGFFMLLGLLQSVLVVIMFRRSKKVRRETGQLLIPPVKRWNWREPKFPKGLIVLLIASAALLAINWARGGDRSVTLERLVTFALFLAIALNMVPLFLWTRSKNGVGYVELRERGMIAGDAFTPWEKIMSFHWSGTAPVHLKLQGRHGLGDLPLDDEHRPAIERVLSERVGAAAGVHAEGPTEGLPASANHG